MPGTLMEFVFVLVILLDVMESITHETIFRLVTTSIAPLRLGPPWRDSSHMSCIVTCREMYTTCESVMFNPGTGKCTPGSVLAATSPLPSTDEGALYVFFDPSSPSAMPSTPTTSALTNSTVLTTTANIWTTSTLDINKTLSTNAVLTSTIATESSSSGMTVADSTTTTTVAVGSTTSSAPNTTTPVANENSTSTSTSTSTIASSPGSSAEPTSTTESGISTSSSSSSVTTSATEISTAEIITSASATEGSIAINCTDAGLAYHVYNNITYCIGLFNYDVTYTDYVIKCANRGSKTLRITTADKLKMLHTISGGTDFWFGCKGDPNYPYRWEVDGQELSDSEFMLLFPPWEKVKSFYAGSCCKYSATNETAYVVECTEQAWFACEL